MSLPFPEGSWCVDCSFATDKLEAVQTGPKMVVEKLNVFASDLSRPVFTQADAVDLHASNANYGYLMLIDLRGFETMLKIGHFHFVFEAYLFGILTSVC